MIANSRKTSRDANWLSSQRRPLNGTAVERVNTLKLPGVHVANDLKWTRHVDAILSKTSSPLYFIEAAEMSRRRTRHVVLLR